MPIRRHFQPINSIVSSPPNVYNVIYQNLAGAPILVLTTVQCTVTAAAGSEAGARADIGTVSPPITLAADVGAENVNAGGPLRIENHVLAFLVPPGYYYRVVTFELNGGTIVNIAWWEIRFMTPFSGGF
jgi:hypothetical protein